MDPQGDYQNYTQASTADGAGYDYTRDEQSYHAQQQNNDWDYQYDDTMYSNAQESQVMAPQDAAYEGQASAPSDNIFSQSTPDEAAQPAPVGETPPPQQTASKGKILADSIKCNDGTMKLEIVSQEMKGSGTSKHVEYKVVGQDSLGSIDVFRRYREFALLRAVLFERYPGLVIPPVPPKQATGNREESFVEERKYFLDQFLKRLCILPHLASSPEVQLFLRPQKKVEDGLKSLVPTNTDVVLSYYRRKLRINPEVNLPTGQVAKYNADINEFIKEQRTLMDHLKNFRSHVTALVPMKEQELKYYKQFADFLQKYEEESQSINDQLKDSIFSKGAVINEAKLISGDKGDSLKGKLDDLSKEMVNPFIHIRNWVKGEMLNLEALMQAIAEKEACDSRKSNAIKRLASDREVLLKMDAGKFTLKGMFAGKSGKAKQIALLNERVAQRERDIQNWDHIKKILIIYITEQAIPDFRDKKLTKYVQAMAGFSTGELKNSEAQKFCWHDFYQLIQQYEANLV